MATKAERVTAILTGVKDGAPTQAVANRILEAFAGADGWRQQWANAQGLAEVPTVEAMTAGQKADLFLYVQRRLLKETVQAFEANRDAEAARLAAIAKASAEIDLGNG